MVAVAARRWSFARTNNRAAASPTSVAGPRRSGVATRAAPFSVASAHAGRRDDAGAERRHHLRAVLQPLVDHSPTPSLTPAVAGTWQLETPDTFRFVASAPLVPSADETVTVPAARRGHSATGKGLAATAPPVHRGPGSTLRLQQLLAHLGYLPVSFTPAGPLTRRKRRPNPSRLRSDGAGTSRPQLVAQWRWGTSNVITTGAVMNVESQHNMKTDGVAGPAVWQQLLADATAGTMDTAPYNYVYVTKDLPETATVYSDGAVAYSTLANTGVAGAPTASAPSRCTNVSCPPP